MRTLPFIVALIGALALLASVACGSSTDTDEDTAPPRPPTATGAAPVQQPPTPTATPAADVAQPATPPDTPSASELAPAQDPTPGAVEAPAPSGGVAVAIGEGTLARYIIGEQLANRDLPNDAIGETSNVTGSIVFDADGNIVPDQSTLVVDVSTLESDSGRRDNYLRGNSLQTATYPEARLAVNEVFRPALASAGKRRGDIPADRRLHREGRDQGGEVGGHGAVRAGDNR